MTENDIVLWFGDLCEQKAKEITKDFEAIRQKAKLEVEKESKAKETNKEQINKMLLGVFNGNIVIK